MKSWKRQWKKELDSVVPEIKGVSLRKTEEKKGFSAIFGKYGWKSFASLGVAMVLVLSVILSVFALQPPAESYTAFAVEINPAAVFVVDGKGEVCSVVSANSDADVILSSEDRVEEMTGKSPKEAVKIFADYAARLGYINLDTDFDVLRVSSYDASFDLESVKSTVEEFFREKGARIAVATEKLSRNDFCDIIGGVSFEDIAAEVKELPTIFTERESAGKTLEEIKNLYENNVNLSIKEYILGLIDELEEKAKKISAIYERNKNFKLKILNDFCDYWTYKSFYSDKAIEKEEMEALLDEYESIYGERIDNLSTLNTMYSTYVNDKDWVGIKNNVEGILGEIDDSISTIIVNCSGILSTWVENFSNNLSSLIESTTETVEGYLNKTVEAINYKFETLVMKYNTEYCKVRSAIEKADYDKLVSEKLGGLSLNEYWQSKVQK